MADQIYKVRDPSGAIREIKGPEGATDEQVIAQAKLLFSSPSAVTPAPVQENRPSLGVKANLEAKPTRAGELVSNTIKETAASIPDMFLNAPTNLLNLGKAAYGTAATALGRSDLAPELYKTPNVFRGEFENQGWIKPQDEPQTMGERLLASGTGGATAGAMGGLPGMVVGGLSNLAGQGVQEATGSPITGILASLLASKGMNVASDYGAKKVAMANELRSQKQPMIDTMNEVRGAGYSIPPSMTNPTMLNKVLEGIGGKAATAQDASIGGNEVTASLARKELGVPSSTGLTSDVLDGLAKTKAQPYRDVAALPGLPPKQVGAVNDLSGQSIPVMGKTPALPSETLNNLRDARLDAKANWKKFSISGGASERAAYEASAAKVASLESEIEKAAVAAGHPELIPAIKQARTDIAKIHDIDRALNTDRGEVSALDLAKARERGVPLSGGLETAAKMGNAYAKAIQDASKVGSPGVSNLNSMLGGGLGAGLGAASGIPGGASLGAIGGMVATPVVQSLIRKMLLSKPYQKTLGTPSYGPGMVGGTASKIPVTSPNDALLRAYILSQQGEQP